MVIKLDFKKAKKYLDEYTKGCDGTYGRYRSWCWCYAKFRPFFTGGFGESVTAEKKDDLALNLAFYLASWGMYRGSSFLLQHDYKFLTEIVDILIDEREKWHPLLDAKLSSYVGKEGKQQRDLLNSLYETIDQKFKVLRNRQGKESDEERKTSRILITKILMGTLACVPALDRFFCETMSGEIEGRPKSLGTRMEKLAEAWKRIGIESVPKPNLDKIADIDYPEAKILDMVYWHAAYRNALAEKVLLKASPTWKGKCKKKSRRSKLEQDAISGVLNNKKLENEKDNFEAIYLGVFGGEEKIEKPRLAGQDKKQNPEKQNALPNGYEQFLDAIASALIANGVVGETDDGKTE